MGKETNITIKTSVDAADMFRRQAKDQGRSLGEHFENIVKKHELNSSDNILIMREDEDKEPKKLIIKGDLIYELKERDFIKSSLDEDSRFGTMNVENVDEIKYTCKIIKSIKGHYIVYEEVMGVNTLEEDEDIEIFRSRASIAYTFKDIDDILEDRIYIDELNVIACEVLEPISEEEFFDL